MPNVLREVNRGVCRMARPGLNAEGGAETGRARPSRKRAQGAEKVRLMISVWCSCLVVVAEAPGSKQEGGEASNSQLLGPEGRSVVVTRVRDHTHKVEAAVDRGGWDGNRARRMLALLHLLGGGGPLQPVRGGARGGGCLGRGTGRLGKSSAMTGGQRSPPGVAQDPKNQLLGHNPYLVELRGMDRGGKG